MRNSIRWSGFVGLAFLAINPLAWGRQAPEQLISSVRVSYSDLDLRHETDAQLMLQRLKNAAFRACGGNPVFHPTYSTAPFLTVARFKQCREEAIERAITDLDAPMLLHVSAKARAADERQDRRARI